MTNCELTDHDMLYPREDIPYDMNENAQLSEDGVNPVSHDPEREWAKNEVDPGGFAITFPGSVPPYYFPGYPGGPNY